MKERGLQFRRYKIPDDQLFESSSSIRSGILTKFEGYKQYSEDELWEEIIKESCVKNVNKNTFLGILIDLVEKQRIIARNHPTFGRIYINASCEVDIKKRQFCNQNNQYPSSKESALQGLKRRYQRHGVCPRCGGTMLGTGRHKRSVRHPQEECDDQMIKWIYNR
jgi:hypothetical protein